MDSVHERVEAVVPPAVPDPRSPHGADSSSATPGEHTASGRQRSQGADGSSKHTLSDRANYWSTIVSAITAAAALLLSLFTSIQLNTSPDLLVSMPRVVEFRTVAPDQFYVLVQPSFYVNEKSDVSTVVSDLKLAVSLRGTAEGGRSFVWVDSVDTTFDDDGKFLHPWIADPGPVVVPADVPQSPLARFEALEQEGLRSGGTWDLALTIDRLDQSPVRIRFCIDVPQNTLDWVLAPGTEQNSWKSLVFRNPSSFTTSEPEAELGECYRIVGPVNLT
jgi:hypothetical protein